MVGIKPIYTERGNASELLLADGKLRGESRYEAIAFDQCLCDKCRIRIRLLRVSNYDNVGWLSRN